MKEKKVQKGYDEEFKRQALELVIHCGILKKAMSILGEEPTAPAQLGKIKSVGTRSIALIRFHPEIVAPRGTTARQVSRYDETLFYPMSARILARTSASSSADTLPFRLAFRARQSRLLT